MCLSYHTFVYVGVLYVGLNICVLMCFHQTYELCFTSSTYPAFCSLTWHLRFSVSFYFPSQLFFTLTLFLFLSGLLFISFCIMLLSLTSVFSPPLTLWPPPLPPHTHLRLASSISPVEFSQLLFPLSMPTHHSVHNGRLLLLCECIVWEWTCLLHPLLLALINAWCWLAVGCHSHHTLRAGRHSMVGLDSRIRAFVYDVEYCVANLCM